MKPGSEQRAHKRVRVRIRAQLGGEGALPRAVEIRDIALGGMFVAAVIRPEEMDAPHTGLTSSDGLVRVRFELDIRGSSQSFEFSGRPARMSDRGFGLSFEGEHAGEARAVIEALTSDSSDAPARVSASGTKVLSRLKDSVSRWLPGRISLFADQAEVRLIARASKSHSNAGQTPFFDAISELKRRIVGLDEVIGGVVGDRLDNLGATLLVEDSEENTETNELSLVEKDKFEMYLSVAEMANKAEHRLDLQLFRLCRYLSVLAQKTIDNTTKPLGPSGICDPFHEHMSEAPISAEALSIIYRSFEDLVVKDIHALYEELLEQFEAAGIEVSLEREKVTVKPRGSARLHHELEYSDTTDRGVPEVPPGAYDTGVGGPQPDNYPGQQSGLPPPQQAPGQPLPDQQPGTPATLNPFDTPPTPPDAAQTADWGKGQSPGPLEPAAQQGMQTPVPDPGFFSAPTAAPVNPFAVPQGESIPDLTAASAAPAEGSDVLDALVPQATPDFLGTTPEGRRAGNIPAGMPYAANFAPRVLQPMAQYTMPQTQAGTAFGAVHALLGLRQSLSRAHAPAAAQSDLDSEKLLTMLGQMQASAAAGTASFRSQLRDAMGFTPGIGAPRHGELGDAIELVSRLCEAMRDDPVVQDSLRGRLDQLEPVIHKVAVLEPAFFELSDHAARKVLNQLARLVPELGAHGADEETFWRGIDELIVPLVNNFDRDMSLFDAVLSELDRIVAEQQAQCQENIKEVIEACRAQERFVRERRQRAGQAPVSAISETGEQRAVSKEWSIWLSRAERLEPGESIEHTAGSVTKRLRLAWVAENKSSFVLTDPRGQKAQTFSHQELAMQLRRGGVTTVRDTELPLVDRALSRVLQDMHGAVERHATHDMPTGLLNRRTFLTRLKNALAEATREGDGVAVLYFQVEEHDEICDQYGEEAGEILMRRVARRVGSGVSDGAELASLDPGSIASFQADATLEQATADAERVCASVNQLKIRWGDVQLSLTLHAGAVLAPPGDNEDEVLTTAERVIGDGTAGSSNVRSESRLKSGGSGMMEYVSLINSTLGTDQLQLRCHRIAPLETGPRARSNYEVLLGVRDARGDAVSAAEFVRAAEHYEQLPALDRWVMRNMMRWMAEHRRWLRHIGGFAINVSARSLEDEHLVEYVLNQLNETGVPPGKVIFEIAESVAADPNHAARGFLRTLSEVGCQFALDDFGAGQRSYSYLRQLQVNYVKVDGNFVRNVLNDEADLAVVKSVNEVAQFMGKKTIAEHVENGDVLRCLRAVGVDFVQGFHVERPIYVEQLTEELLKEMPPSVAAASEASASGAGGRPEVAEHTLKF